MKSNKTKSAVPGILALTGANNGPQVFEIPLPTDLVFYLYGAIENEADYVDMLHAIRYAQEGQEITIHINSPGGNLNVCLAVVNAIRISSATVTTVIDGEAASAAAMIWLAGDQKAISSKHVILMLHTASTGFMPSKIPEIKSSIDITTKVIKALLEDLAVGIITADELEDIYKGVDVWLTGGEIMERLNMTSDGDEEDTEDEA